MIIQTRADGSRLLIPQPAHSFLSGQILAAWGAPGFALPDPAPEVILAAAMHDIAWFEWEAAPTLDPETGLPHAFTALGPAMHAPMWSESAEKARASWGLWPALLISLHGMVVYTRLSDPETESEEDKAVAEAHVAREARVQRAWTDALGAAPERIKTASALMEVSDALSLALCFGQEEPAGDAPLTDGSLKTLNLTRTAEDTWTLSPWPFRDREITLNCDATRLEAGQRWDDEATMRNDLRKAPCVPFKTVLRPG